MTTGKIGMLVIPSLLDTLHSTGLGLRPLAVLVLAFQQGFGIRFGFIWHFIPFRDGFSIRVRRYHFCAIRHKTMARTNRWIILSIAKVSHGQSNQRTHRHVLPMMMVVTGPTDRYHQSGKQWSSGCQQTPRLTSTTFGKDM